MKCDNICEGEKQIPHFGELYRKRGESRVYLLDINMANGKSSVNVKIDADVKELAIQLLQRMGIDQTTAIDMFFRQIIAERRLPFQPAASLSLEEQIVASALKRNPKRVSLPTDENGNVIIDKEKHPDIYDWAVNG